MIYLLGELLANTTLQVHYIDGLSARVAPGQHHPAGMSIVYLLGEPLANTTLQGYIWSICWWSPWPTQVYSWSILWGSPGQHHPVGIYST